MHRENTETSQTVKSVDKLTKANRKSTKGLDETFGNIVRIILDIDSIIFTKPQNYICR